MTHACLPRCCHEHVQELAAAEAKLQEMQVAADARAAELDAARTAVEAQLSAELATLQVSQLDNDSLYSNDPLLLSTGCCLCALHLVQVGLQCLCRKLLQPRLRS
jgi:hypothetical protein